MIANYHTHTYRCHHAYGEEEGYVLEAIKQGLKTLGFSDHSTYLFPGDYASTHRMSPKEIGDYVSTIRALKEKYKDKIDIKIGFECEYYPELWEKTLAQWREFGIEYLILGQHYVGREFEGAPPASRDSDSEEKLIKYVDLVVEALATGKISCVAHPDLINFTGDDEIYKREMKRLIRAAIAADVPLELNLLGVRVRRHYPTRKFWDLVRGTDAKVIIGCDAHEKESVANGRDLADAYSFLERCGISNIIETLDFKPI